MQAAEPCAALSRATEEAAKLPPEEAETKQSVVKEVVLYTLPPVSHVYSICPFAIKLESFLRLNGIPYETKFTTSDFGPKRTFPFARLRSAVPVDQRDDTDAGELIADSNVIISKLTEEYGLEKHGDGNADNGRNELNAAERAVAHAFTRMVEEHTAQIGFHYRYGLHMEDFYDSLDIDRRYYSSKSPEERESKREMWTTKQPEYTRNKTKYRGLGRHTEEELWAFSNDDLQAMSDYLGDKPFFFGREAATLDCTLFGHLTQFLYIPMDFPQKSYVHKKCQNLVNFVERFKAKYWPDWDDKCNIVWVPEDE